jgi:hypothetical protein
MTRRRWRQSRLRDTIEEAVEVWPGLLSGCRLLVITEGIDDLPSALVGELFAVPGQASGQRSRPSKLLVGPVAQQLAEGIDGLLNRSTCGG